MSVEHAHHTHETLEEAAHHKHKNPLAVRIGFQVALMAAVLAIVETGAKETQTAFFQKSVEVNDLWAFYQAKTIRANLFTVQADALELSAAGNPQAAEKAAAWRANAARLESEPDKGEGRKELLARAKKAEQERDGLLHQLHKFEYGSAAIQLGIVVTSSAMVLSMPALAAGGAALGVVGAGIGVYAWMTSAGH